MADEVRSGQPDYPGAREAAIRLALARVEYELRRTLDVYGRNVSIDVVEWFNGDGPDGIRNRAVAAIGITVDGAVTQRR